MHPPISRFYTNSHNYYKEVYHLSEIYIIPFIPKEEVRFYPPYIIY